MKKNRSVGAGSKITMNELAKINQTSVWRNFSWLSEKVELDIVNICVAILVGASVSREASLILAKK